MSTRETTREIMFAKIRDWQTSGSTQKLFWEQHNLKHNTFYYWYKQFRKTESSLEDGFIPVTFPQTSAPAFASVVFSSGGSLQLHQVVSAQMGIFLQLTQSSCIIHTKNGRFFISTLEATDTSNMCWIQKRKHTTISMKYLIKGIITPQEI